MICSWCEKDKEIIKVVDDNAWCQDCLDLLEGIDVTPVDEPHVDGLDLEVWVYDYNQRRVELALSLLAIIIGLIIAILGIFLQVGGWFIPGGFMIFLGASCTMVGALSWGHSQKDDH